MKISIVTINYNNVAGLKTTFTSVLNQTHKDIEYIVIDGGSTDKSVELIAQYQALFSYYVSEPDKGIYDALNKGIDRATGEYILFLNSGDCLYDDEVLENFNKLQTTEDIVYGSTLIINGKKKWIKELKGITDLASSLSNTINHQSIFHNKKLFENNTRYSLEYPLSADWVFLNEAVRTKNVVFRELDFIVAIYDGSGVSSDWSLVDKEHNRYLTSTFSPEFRQVLHSFQHQVSLNKAIRRKPVVKQMLQIKNYLNKFITN